VGWRLIHDTTPGIKTHQASDLASQLDDQRALTKQLEDDLLASRGASTPGTGGGAAPGATAAVAPLSPGASASLDGGLLDGGSGAAAAGGDESVMRVLVGQRERLQRRVKQLEEELAGARAAAEAARGQLEAARADNVALVERLRYVGGYRQQAAARKVSDGAGVGGGRPGSRWLFPRGDEALAAASVYSSIKRRHARHHQTRQDATAGRGPAADVEAGGAGDVVGRYSQLYEERINPFREFQVRFLPPLSGWMGRLVGRLGGPLLLEGLHCLV
jgi:hypothetical protein